MPAKGSSRWPTLKGWIEYGEQRDYNQRNPMSLDQSDDKDEQAWYRRGEREKWLVNFSFQRIYADRSSWGTEEQWRSYGFENGYDKRNSASLSNSKDNDEKSWYRKGNKNRWARDFPFTKSEKWISFKEWKEFGIREGYEATNPTSLLKSEDPVKRSWSSKGNRKKWWRRFEFNKGKVVFKSKKAWVDIGNENGYDQRNPSSLAYSTDLEERRWYVAGKRKGWLGDFSFKRRIAKRNRFKTFEEWVQFGEEEGFTERKPNDLRKSENEDERAWYNYGSTRKWIKKFSFAEKQTPLPYQDFSEWEKHGIERGYTERARTSFKKSEDPEERSWLNKGYREGWVDKFSFLELQINPKNFGTEEEWKRYGLENRLNEINVATIQKKGSKVEKAWYRKGIRKGWVKSFPFASKRVGRSPFQTLDEWVRNGLEKGYNEKTSTGLAKSDKLEERSWWGKGAREGWLDDFTFRNPKQPERELEAIVESYVGGEDG